MTRSDLRSRSTSTLLAAFGMVAALFGYSFRLVRVEGPSMEPTFHNGQWLLMRRDNWPTVPFRCGDVVVFRLGPDILVKRVAALPGDFGPMQYLGPIHYDPAIWKQGGYCRTAMPDSILCQVPKDHLYVLGDNANNSDDSRYFGPIPASAIIGRVIEWDPIEPALPTAVADRPAPRRTALARVDLPLAGVPFPGHPGPD
jgi:signal peptidase I